LPRKRAKAKFLPTHVTAEVDRHGKTRLRFRKRGCEGGYFKSGLGSKEFKIEYDAFLAGSTDTVAAAIKRTVPGSIDDLVTRYIAVPTRLGPTDGTQTRIRGILGRFREEYGELPVAQLTFDHVDAIIAEKRIKRVEQTPKGPRTVGGPDAARKLRKELLRLFDYGKKLGLLPANPVADSERVKIAPAERSKGYYSWTEEDIAQFRARHQLGTKPRLAMELMLWTDQRRIDSIHLGRQHIKDGRFHIGQSKNGKELWIAVAPQLLEAIVAMPPQPTSGMCFLLTEWGKPFSNAGFGNWFRARCNEAGLPRCTAHGLRKATMRRMAELGMGNQTMKAVSGHSKDDEVALYTAAANQRKMADGAIRALSRWEKRALTDAAKATND
jgi:integrase